MNRIVVFIIVTALFSCKKTQEVNSSQTSNIAQEVVKVSKSDITKISYNDFILGSKGEKAVLDWKSYSELETIVKEVKQANFSYFKNNNEVIKAFVKDFKSTIPKSIDTPSVAARVVVIETMLYKLESSININTTSKNSLILSIKAFLQSASNLHLQINKKFEKEGQNILKP